MTGSSVVRLMSRGLPSAPFASHQCFGRIWNWPRIIGSSLIVLFVETEGDVAFAGLFDRNDMPVVAHVKRIEFLRLLEAEDYVFRGDGLAVGPLAASTRSRKVADETSSG